jgi:hypothetical protein
VSEKMGDWNWGNVQSVGGCCLVVGDKLYFYVSGRAGKSFPGCNYNDAGASTGLAVLRRDGFASMDAGKQEATLTTRPVRFSGKHFFVNADTASWPGHSVTRVPGHDEAGHGVTGLRGQLLVEVLGADGKHIAPFTRNNCVPISADSTIQPVKWKGALDLSSLAGKPVRFRFHLRNGSLYAFWVSPDASGASHGYVAAGGPGFTGLTDTVGATASRQ